MEEIRNGADAEIVDSIRNGQQMEVAIKAIYRNYFEVLSRYIIQNSGCRQDSEDIFQEVVVSFIELVQNGKFRGKSSLKTFLLSINRYTWLNELKRRKRELTIEEKYEKGQEKVEMDTCQLIAKREEKAAVAAVVASLGESCRKILLLYYFENLSFNEILKVTDYKNEQVVRNKKYICIKQLQKMLNEKPHLNKTLKNLVHV